MATTTLTKSVSTLLPRDGGLAQQVRLARRLLQLLLTSVVIIGLLTSIVGYQAVQVALANYRQIVDEGSSAANAAQAARESLLIYHGAAADFLTLDDVGQRNTRKAEAQGAWVRYQEEMRRSWRNLTDVSGQGFVYGEDAVFRAADAASWQYASEMNAMFAFADGGGPAQAAEMFKRANTTLVQRVIPALNGMERARIESMEETYATTEDQIRGWLTAFGFIATITVVLLLLGLGLTRFWLHYGATWQLVVASAVGILLVGWFFYSLLNAANEVEVMVRDAYDTVSGVQSIKALATQANALESVAIFDPANVETALRDHDQYIFLLEQQLCGDRDCWRSAFTGGLSENEAPAAVVETAQRGQSTYSLPRPPLIANVNFQGEVAALEEMRRGVQLYDNANERIVSALRGGDPAAATQINQNESARALEALLAAADKEGNIARTEFNRIWDTVRTQMEINIWLAFLFTAAAALGAWGLSLRRQHLFP